MARIIGIDLGSWAVKATVLEGGFSRFEVETQRSAPVAQSEGSLPSVQARLEALSALLSDLDTDETCQFGAGFPVNQASMRLVQMPFTDKNQIAQTLEFEVEGLVPYDLEDMSLSHRIVDATGEGSGVLAAMVPKEKLHTHIHQLSDVGADPKSLAIDGDALGVYGDHGTEAVIDIGHSRTIVTVIMDNQATFSRGISIGGWHLTQALRETFGFSEDEAQKRKHSARLATTAVAEWDDEEETQADTSDENLAEISRESQVLLTALAPLLASIRTTLVGFEDSSGSEIDRIKLTGGSSELAGLENLMKVEMGVPVTKLRTGSRDLHAPAGHALSGAHAERAAGIGGSRTMELRQGDFKYRGNMANLRLIVLACAAVVLCGIGVGIGLFAYEHQQASQRLSALDAQLVDAVALASGTDAAELNFESPDDALLALQMKTLETSGLIDLLGPVVSGIPPVVSTLSQLSTALPDPGAARIDVSDLTVTAQAINMKATTEDYDAAANIEAALVENIRFKRARKGDEKKTILGISFTVNIPLEEEAGEEG